MRKSDQNKINAIKESVLDLSYKVGISNITTAKIAKNAGVSPATIYIHYQDKTDLLSRLYEEVKTNLHSGLNEAIDKNLNLESQIKQAIVYSISQYRKYPKQAYFMSTLWSNQEMLDEKAINFGNTMEGPLKDLFERIESSEEYLVPSPTILAIFFTVPTLVLQRQPDIDKNMIDQLSEMIIKAIKK